MQIQDEWENRYQNKQMGWDRGAASPALLAWLESGDLQPCRILIPGCGLGHEVVELARRGFEVTAIDIAPSAIRHLQEVLTRESLSANVIFGDLFEYTARQPFDAIYEQTCLCALPPHTLETYEARLYEWLRPGGQVLAMFMQTGKEGGPPFHCDIQAMQVLFSQDRWQWSDAPIDVVDHPSGRHELARVLKRR